MAEDLGVTRSVAANILPRAARHARARIDVAPRPQLCARGESRPNTRAVAATVRRGATCGRGRVSTRGGRRSRRARGRG